MNLVEQFDKEYNDLLALEQKISSEEYEKEWFNFLNRQNQIDIEAVDNCERIINKRFHDQPDLKETSRILNDKFRDIAKTFKEYLNSNDNDEIWADLLKKYDQINRFKEHINYNL